MRAPHCGAPPGGWQPCTWVGLSISCVFHYMSYVLVADEDRSILLQRNAVVYRRL